MMRDNLRAAGVSDDLMTETIISIKELAAPVLGGALWGHHYPNKLIICPVDNQTACRWIAKLEADNYVARGILAVLARQSARNHNELVAPYMAELGYTGYTSVQTNAKHSRARWHVDRNGGLAVLCALGTLSGEGGSW